MKSKPLPPITPLPVLIRSSEHTSLDGAGTVFGEDTEITGLHVVSKEEALSGKGWKTLGTKQRQLVSGVALLQRALRDKDWMAFQTALDLVQTRVPRVHDGHIRGIRGSKKWTLARWAYSGLMSNLLQKARVIIWCSPQDKDNRLRPGLFCPDWEVATYAFAGMDYQRICKKFGCGERFIPGPKSHEYCCVKCQNADAQARWRAAHPEQVREQARRARDKARRTKKARKCN
jgi:hypothetical protein